MKRIPRFSPSWLSVIRGSGRIFSLDNFFTLSSDFRYFTKFRRVLTRRVSGLSETMYDEKKKIFDHLAAEEHRVLRAALEYGFWSKYSPIAGGHLTQILTKYRPRAASSRDRYRESFSRIRSERRSLSTPPRSMTARLLLQRRPLPAAPSLI